MGYTWEDVMLGIDVKTEAQEKEEREREIQEKRLEESSAMGWWSLGLSLIGGALFGPVGFAAGKFLGRTGADLAYDWESERIDVGKFDRERTKEFNRTIKKAAEDQTGGQILSSLTDLATMYIQAGGFKEGFDPTIGGGDWTTFGTGEDAWTVFGSDTPTYLSSDEAMKVGLKSATIPGTGGRGIPYARVLPTEQALWQPQGGFISNIGRLGKNLGSAYTQGESVDYFWNQWLQSQAEEEAEEGSTFGALQSRDYNLLGV